MPQLGWEKYPFNMLPRGYQHCNSDLITNILRYLNLRNSLSWNLSTRYEADYLYSQLFSEWFSVIITWQFSTSWVIIFTTQATIYGLSYTCMLLARVFGVRTSQQSSRNTPQLKFEIWTQIVNKILMTRHQMQRGTGITPQAYTNVTCTLSLVKHT